MVPAKLLGPSDLAKTRALYIHETTKVVMIGKNDDLMFATFKLYRHVLKVSTMARSSLL